MADTHRHGGRPGAWNYCGCFYCEESQSGGNGNSSTSAYEPDREYYQSCFPSLRPVEMLDAVHVVGPLLRSGSFPSGHAAAAIAAGLSIAFYGSFKPTGLLAIFVAFFIGISRIFVGAHFPKDVLAGMVCAFVLFLIVRALLVRLSKTGFPIALRSAVKHFGPHSGWKSLPHSSRCSSMVRTTLNYPRYRSLWLRWCSFGSQ